MKNFTDKVVVVTGAGSGMGRAYALEFAKLGAKLALNDCDATALQVTLDQLGSTTVHSEVFDVSKADAMTTFADNVKSKLGNAHVVINNAGIEGAVKPVWALTVEEHERIMGVNYYGVVNGTAAFMPQLMANDEAAVVNISSIFGLIGTPNSGDYCASKFAVRGYTEALMTELQESHVNAFLVHPGGIATNIVRRDGAQDFAAKYLTTPPEKIAKHVIKCIGKGRVRIVYGRDSFKTWMASIFVPLRLRKWLIWREIKPVVELEHYPHGKSDK